MSSSTGIILFAHGSRDALWRFPIEAVRERIQSQSPEVAVRCAYLELCAPDLPTTIQELTDQGASSITVVPMFLGTGKHAREDLPQLMKKMRVTHPQVDFCVQPAIGEDPRMTALMACIACTSSKSTIP